MHHFLPICPGDFPVFSISSNAAKIFLKKVLTTVLFYVIIYIETEVIAMKKLFGFIAIILLIWFIVSLIDVDIHNMSTQSYWKYNMFNLFMEVTDK